MNKQTGRPTLKERLLITKSHVKFFFLKLFGRVSVFSGFDVSEPIVLRQNRKYMSINHCVIDGDNGGHITMVG